MRIKDRIIIGIMGLYIFALATPGIAYLVFLFSFNLRLFGPVLFFVPISGFITGVSATFIPKECWNKLIG